MRRHEAVGVDSERRCSSYRSEEAHEVEAVHVVDVQRKPGDAAGCHVIDALGRELVASDARHPSTVAATSSPEQHIAGIGLNVEAEGDSRSDCRSDCPSVLERQVARGERETLGEARERLDRVPQHVDRHLGSDRERRLLQPLARSGPIAAAPTTTRRSRSATSFTNPVRFGRSYVDERDVAVHLPRRADEARSLERSDLGDLRIGEDDAGTAR